MKTALITTTINVPKVLALYRKFGPDVRFFVAGDQKTPEDAVNYCTHDIPNCHFIYTSEQDKWKHSKHIGWNTDSRRNIALLEALKWGAEIIVSIDDDMIPMDSDFFERIEMTLTQPYSGLQFGYPGLWFDAGRFTVPPARQRGLPAEYPHGGGNIVTFVEDVQIGAMQGIILGTPDTDAATTVTNNPKVLSATDVLRNGFVVDPKAYSVFDSQITAFRRELAPCFAQFYKWQGRNTDLFASLIMRRVMRDRGLYTYFGPPTGFHARAVRDPFKDLKAEMWGLEHVAEFASWLDTAPSKTCLAIYNALAANLPWWPQELAEATLAWCDDVETVL